MSSSSAKRFINWVMEVIIKRVTPQYVNLPNTREEWKQTSKGFQNRAGANMLNVAGAIDGTLIEVLRPRQHEGLYTRKGFTGFNVQVLCKADYTIMSFCVAPGSRHDSTVYKESELYTALLEVLPQDFYIVGDKGYPLLYHLMTPYRNEPETRTPEQKIFNHRHSQTRTSVENCIGLLKGRFRIAQKPLDQKVVGGNEEKSWLHAQAAVVTACITLHNILIHLHDMPDDVVRDQREQVRLERERRRIDELANPVRMHSVNVAGEPAKARRDMLARALHEAKKRKRVQ